MANFMLYAPLVIALYLLSFSLVVKTQDLIGSTLFKIIPFFSGLSLLFIFLKQSAII